MPRTRFLVLALLVTVPGLVSCGETGKSAGAVSSPTQRATAGQPTTSATPSASATPGKAAGTRLGHYRNVALSRGQGGLGFVHAPGKERLRDDIYKGDTLWKGKDLNFDFEIEAHRLKLLPLGVRGGYRVCRDRTRRSTTLKLEAVYVGSLICVITESGLVGLVKVKELRWGWSSDHGIFVFDLTVWQGP